METSAEYTEGMPGQAGYFLAGHRAPAGRYHETQTGRELQMNEAGILPATCDGHVAVYVRQALTWAERTVKPVISVSREGAS